MPCPVEDGEAEALVSAVVPHHLFRFANVRMITLQNKFFTQMLPNFQRTQFGKADLAVDHPRLLRGRREARRPGPRGAGSTGHELAEF